MPLKAMMKALICSYDVAYSDETIIQVVKEPKKSIGSKKYMWLFAGGPPDQFVFYCPILGVKPRASSTSFQL
jgi:hypothetical protein